MSPIDTARFRELLEEERRRIVEAASLYRDDHQPFQDQAGEETAYVNHPADLATATFDRELDYTLEDSSNQVLAAIDAALKRIENGTYGVCRRCGRPISEERLEAVPYAELCIDCKREVERS
jgi:RNA polymerase-binding protein DksA